MARLPNIQLDWWKDPKGYHLTGQRVVRNGGHRDQLVLCQPLDTSQTLFRVFANEATTPEGVLDFVQKYGPLTMYGNDQGDRVPEVIRRAEIMRDTLKWMSAQPQRPMPSEDTFFGPGVALQAWLDWDRGSRKPVWKLRPTTLIDGLWLQFAQAVTRGIELRACTHCGDLFETGIGTGRRLDAKFCSDEHRIAFNSLKRSKEK
jgi:hypothetical protein